MNTYNFLLLAEKICMRDNARLYNVPYVTTSLDAIKTFVTSKAEDKNSELVVGK